RCNPGEGLRSNVGPYPLTPTLFPWEREHSSAAATLGPILSEEGFTLRKRSLMTAALRFDPIRLPPECVELRKEVRAFLAEEIAGGTFNPFKPNREDIDVP